MIPTTASVATRKLPGERPPPRGRQGGRGSRSMNPQSVGPGEASQDPQGSVVPWGGGVGPIASQLLAWSGAVGAPRLPRVLLERGRRQRVPGRARGRGLGTGEGLLGRHHHQLVNAPHPHPRRGPFLASVSSVRSRSPRSSTVVAFQVLGGAASVLGDSGGAADVWEVSCWSGGRIRPLAG